MKATHVPYTFEDILKSLAKQDPEVKLRSAFRLREFVLKIRAAGDAYAKTHARRRTGRTS